MILQFELFQFYFFFGINWSDYARLRKYLYIIRVEYRCKILFDFWRIREARP